MLAELLPHARLDDADTFVSVASGLAMRGAT
jgi:hypothetical protein